MHMIQCTMPPKLWPLARTSAGNISEMNTQMTALAENATAAMKPYTPNIASHGVHAEPRDICHATSPCIAAIAAHPDIRSGRRPNRSIRKNAATVKMRLTIPTPIVPASATMPLPSPKIILKMRGA